MLRAGLDSCSALECPCFVRIKHTLVNCMSAAVPSRPRPTKPSRPRPSRPSSPRPSRLSTDLLSIR